MGVSFKSGLLCAVRRYKILRVNVPRNRPTDFAKFYKTAAAARRRKSRSVFLIPRWSSVSHQQVVASNAARLSPAMTHECFFFVILQRRPCKHVASHIETWLYAHALLQKSVKRLCTATVRAKERTPRRT